MTKRKSPFETKVHYKRRKAMEDYWRRYWGEKGSEWKGTKFGKLTVDSVYSKKLRTGKRVTMANCKCECGRWVDVRLGNLHTGNTRSCGCGTLSKLVSRTPSERKKTITEYCKEAGISRATFYNWAKPKKTYGNSK